ncbi:MAG: NAD-dependent epimerase/dehydratase family protein [Phycisphaerales bacterium]|nr:NAD-dependent epimerase/dehydratase family protein [Phycisphaerae bacterium]NNF43434.1 NAD-dependent epimerase/dehydratase family protein [Phycisphaerales bacterium]NNM26597.1 NAD-dependent epimerase/dehydratase family protein [Phycisphaerales bacterium]
METRRTFLLASAGTAALPAFAARRLLADDAPIDRPTRRPLKILFLGGTGFLGPHIVRFARARGHAFTLFNRGRRPDLFADVETIIGNRIEGEGPGLTPLREQVEAGRRWDVVIDTASVHQWTERTATMLAKAADQYVYISSLSAYAEASSCRTEGDPVATMPDEIAAGIDRIPYDMTHYGAVKARSEAAAEAAFPGRATVMRPGLIVGPRDRTHRFTYWPHRIRAGGEVLTPGNPTDPVMFIDVRDVADFVVLAMEERLHGIYNTNGPVGGGMTIGKLVEACRVTTGSDASFTWADADFLSERNIGGWVQMPVWLPPKGEYKGFHCTSVERARRAGLRTRPLDDTIRVTLAWLDGWLPEAKAERGYEYTPGENAPGITREREQAVLAEWHGREG